MTFDPSSLSGKLLWLRGKDLGAAGSTIASWPDQSGLGHDATVSSGTPLVAASLTPTAATDNTHYGPVGPDGGASYAVDGDPATYWTTNGVAAGWMRLQFPAAVAVSTYTIRRRDDIPARNPKTWTFEGSNDGTTFTVLDTQTNITWSTSGETKSFTVAATTAYLYYRLNITANNGDTYTSVAELTLLGPDKGMSTRNAVVALPTDTAGGTDRELWVVVIAGSPTGNAGEDAWRFGSSGDTTVFPYRDGRVYDGSFSTTRQNFAYTVTPVNTKRLYRVTMTGGVWTAYLDGVQQVSVSGLTFGLNSSPKLTNGWSNGTIYEVLVRNTVSTSADVANLITYFNTEHAMAVPGGSSNTPSTTGTLPVTAAAPSAARTIGSSAGKLSIAVGLAASALTVGATTGSLPVRVATTAAATTQLRGTTAGQLAATTSVSATAATRLPVGVTTGSLPVGAALGSAAAGVLSPTTGTLPVAVALVSASSTVGVPSTTGVLPLTIGTDATASTAIALGRWTAEQSQAALLDFEPVGGPLLVEPAVAVAPAWITEQPIRRQSHVMPALVPDANGQIRSDGSYMIVDEVVGVPHLFISNRDVTYFRNIPTVIQQWGSSLPGGDDVAAVEFPQLTFGDVPGSGDLAWLVNDAPAEIYLIDANGHRIQPAMFCGNLVSDNVGHTETDLTNGWHLEGALSQANYQGHRMPTYLAATDIGPLIAKLLNGVISRRYAPLKPVNTSIMTRDRGSYGDTEWGYVHNLLGTAWTTDGHQWTISRTSTPRAFKIALKDTSTVNWTVTAGAPGVEVDLTADQSSVVHAIYGRGVNTDGYTWAGWCYPNLHNDTAPPYPYSSASTTMSIGSTDAGTVSGRGVSDWQERARQLGYRIDITGVFSGADDTACREIQQRDGLLVDGIVGPQTWAATWAVGSNAGSLDGAYRRPLAVLPAVEPHLYAADGAIVGPNPAYQPKIIRRELDIDYGPGVTRAEATKSATQQLARDGQPGWAGKIVMRTDPHEGSRFMVFEGQNIKLRGFRGGDQLLHVVSTQKTTDADMAATFTVDSKARDAMSLSAILSRDRTTNADPLRRKRHQSRSSRVEIDTVVPFDGESGAGVIPRMALYGGLWSVIRIPISQVGTIAKIDVSTSGPATPFAFALFGAPIQPSHLVRYVGDPLATSGPFTTHAGELEDDFGFIEGFGEQGQAAGYYPGSEKNGSLTGRLYETPGGLIYRSTVPPWVWVAMYAQSSCFISGRIYPSPVA